MTLNEGIWVGSRFNKIGIMIRRHQEDLFFSKNSQRKKPIWGHKKAAFYKSGRKLSPEIETCWTLILDFKPPETWEIHLCCWSPMSVVFCYPFRRKYPFRSLQKVLFNCPHSELPKQNKHSVLQALSSSLITENKAKIVYT